MNSRKAILCLVGLTVLVSLVESTDSGANKETQKALKELQKKMDKIRARVEQGKTHGMSATTGPFSPADTKEKEAAQNAATRTYKTAHGDEIVVGRKAHEEALAKARKAMREINKSRQEVEQRVGGMRVESSVGGSTDTEEKSLPTKVYRANRAKTWMFPDRVPMGSHFPFTILTGELDDLDTRPFSESEIQQQITPDAHFLEAWLRKLPEMVNPKWNMKNWMRRRESNATLYFDFELLWYGSDKRKGTVEGFRPESLKIDSSPECLAHGNVVVTTHYKVEGAYRHYLADRIRRDLRLPTVYDLV